MNRIRNNRQGAAAVEFALVFPLVMTFFIGLIGVTQAFLVRDMTQLAAYEACRKGTVLNATADDVRARAREVLSSMNLKNYQLVVIPENITDSTKDIEVRVIVPFSDNAWVGGPLFPHNWSVGSKIKLKRIFDE